MAIPSVRTLRRISTPDFFGGTRYVYSNYLLASTDVIAADFFEDDSIPFAERDLMWAKLSDGYFVLRFINGTTAEIATD